MLRLAILASHPIQYQAPLFRALAARGDIALKVFFCWDFGVKHTRDPGFNQSLVWDVPLLDGYEHEFLPNLATRPSSNAFFGLVNPSVITRVMKWKPDALVVHGYAHFTELLSLGTSLVRGVPVLMRGDSNVLTRRSVSMRIAKQLALQPLMRTLSGAIASGTLNRMYYERYGVPRERITLAPFSVDNSFFQRRADQARVEAKVWRAELGIGAEEKVVLFAGKLIPEKSCETLILAFAAHRRPGARLVLVGDGPLRQELEALARAHPDARIHFVGFANQSRMPAAYAMGDVFVLPSIVEAWGLAVNEAMNLGLPVIVSDLVGAAPDLVTPENGWVFQARNVRSLSATLDEALADSAALANKGAASLDRIRAWDLPHTAEGFVQAAKRAVLQ